MKKAVVKASPLTMDLSPQRFLPDGCLFYPLYSRKLQLESSSSSSPKSPKSPKSLSSPSQTLFPLPPPFSPTQPHTEYHAAFLGRSDHLTELPNQSLTDDVISRVLTTPNDPCDLVIRVGLSGVTLLADKKTEVLGEFSYSSLCGCGQGSTHQTCFIVVSVHMATGQTRFNCFVCEAVSFEQANLICGHIAQGFGADKT